MVRVNNKTIKLMKFNKKLIKNINSDIYLTYTALNSKINCINL
ncbi:hypothetical protein SH1V18_15770 [Vallitalea longa]|uniref:Uncharacterized protein n=1 Tax=Vallitalea longa TaxID=2936439 RepID=A0A9W5Y910_9FIRM|nr:hypothetical protein SH1V18_15770 [Vallitalea longa]